MWSVYDEPIAGIPPGLTASSCNLGPGGRRSSRTGTPASPLRRTEEAPSACTVELRGIIERLGLVCGVVESEDEGRWFVLSRPGS